MNEIILNEGETKRILRERKYKKGYIIRDEYWRTHFEDKPNGHALLIKKQAYNLKNELIGDSKFAYYLIVKHRIVPQKARKNHCCCSIGFCKENNKWYGWSHRAICGFGINDMLFDSNWRGVHSNEEIERIPFIKRGYVKCKTLDNAKRAAINFAEYVS